MQTLSFGPEVIWTGQIEGDHFRVKREQRRKGFTVERFDKHAGDGADIWQPIYNLPLAYSIIERALFDLTEKQHA